MSLGGIEIVPVIKSLGYLGVWGILFAESGILFFFFLPGDSLLFTAGFLASQGFLNIAVLIGGGLAAAIVGNIVGYMVGKHIGLRLFNKFEGKFLKRKHLEMAERFYAQHGTMAVITARFMPIIRTFVPFVAGLVQMDFKKFVMHTITGAVAWVAGLCLFGYFFGQLLPPEAVDKYLLPIIIAIIVISLVPSFVHIWKERKAGAGH